MPQEVLEPLKGVTVGDTIVRADGEVVVNVLELPIHFHLVENEITSQIQPGDRLLLSSVNVDGKPEAIAKNVTLTRELRFIGTAKLTSQIPLTQGAEARHRHFGF